MNTPIFLTALACTLSSLHAASPPGVEVLPWKDGKKASLVIMFDDNLESQRINAVPELEKLGIKATFYPNPGKYDFMNKPFWTKELPALGHDYGVHTMTHRVPDEAAAEWEIRDSAEILRKLNPSKTKSPLMSFARPGGKGAFEISREKEAELLLKNQLVSRDGKGLFMYVGQTPDELEKWLDGLIKSGGGGRICFHGVGGDYIPVSMEVFTAFLDAVQARADRLWVAPHLAIHKYEATAKKASATIKDHSKDRISIQLQSEVDLSLFDEPLSLAVNLPAGWQSLTVQQGDAGITPVIQDRVARFDAHPGSTPIILLKSK